MDPVYIISFNECADIFLCSHDSKLIKFFQKHKDFFDFFYLFLSQTIDFLCRLI